MGVERGFTLTLPKLLREIAAGSFSDIVIPGDMVYEAWFDNANLGNVFMRGLEPAARTGVAIQAVAGNHEAPLNFLHFTGKFDGLRIGAGERSGSNSPRYYSWDQGLVHFVGIDTEFDYLGGTAAEIQAQRDWLLQDLAKVDRRKRPWIVAYGHKHMWMDSQNFRPLENMLNDAGVNVYLAGHQHNLQRYFPMDELVPDMSCVVDGYKYVDCQNMTSIIVGSAGNREGLYTSNAGGSRLAVFKQLYGYGVFEAVNQTHLHWVWTATADNSMNIYPDPATAPKDEVWFIRSNPDPLLLDPEEYDLFLPSMSPTLSSSPSMSATPSVTAETTATISPSSSSIALSNFPTPSSTPSKMVNPDQLRSISPSATLQGPASASASPSGFTGSILFVVTLFAGGNQTILPLSNFADIMCLTPFANITFSNCNLTTHNGSSATLQVLAALAPAVPTPRGPAIAIKDILDGILSNHPQLIGVSATVTAIGSSTISSSSLPVSDSSGTGSGSAATNRSRNVILAAVLASFGGFLAIAAVVVSVRAVRKRASPHSVKAAGRVEDMDSSANGQVNPIHIAMDTAAASPDSHFASQLRGADIFNQSPNDRPPAITRSFTPSLPSAINEDSAARHGPGTPVALASHQAQTHRIASSDRPVYAPAPIIQKARHLAPNGSSSA
jgi:hypothetical protein